MPKRVRTSGWGAFWQRQLEGKGPFYCAYCQLEFRPKNPKYVTFCSQQCAFDYKATPRFEAIKYNECRICGVLYTYHGVAKSVYCSLACFKVQRRLEAYNRSKAKNDSTWRKCLACGQEFVRLYGTKMRFCSESCSDLHQKYRERYRVYLEGAKYGVKYPSVYMDIVRLIREINREVNHAYNPGGWRYDANPK